MEKHPSETNIKWALFLNLVFTLIEFAGGLWTQSLAILSDALHDLGDSTALGMAWFMERLSHKQRTSRYSYGYRRFSLLGALIKCGHFNRRRFRKTSILMRSKSASRRWTMFCQHTIPISGR